MPLPSLSEIEQRRTRLGMTQQKLAGLARVSRSSLTKIELAYRELKPEQRPSYVPNYEDAKRIFEALEREEAQVRPGILTERIGTFAHSPVDSVSPSDKVYDAQNLMKKHDFSQIPVLKDGVCVGRVTEKTILKAIEEKGSPERVYQLQVSSLMEEPFPILGRDTLLGSAMPILKEQMAVLTFTGGKIDGIITAYDVMVA